MASTVASYRTRQPAQVLTVHSYRPKVKFDAAFIERRMSEHKQWQQQQAAEDAAEIVSEVISAFSHVSKTRAYSANQKRLRMSEIHLGYELETGKPVSIPVRHLCVTGQTQESGKTTTLEGLIARSGRRSIAFVTKRGERSFESGRKILPYFRERADWEFIESVLEAIMRQKMKFERAWIVRACKGAHSLADVRHNISQLMTKSKRSMDQDIYMLLGEYLDKVLPLLARLPKADAIQLETGLNVMDLRSYPEDLQMLIVASSLRWVHEQEHEVISILPEAWKFAPQGRNTPVKLEVRKIAREGAGLKNYLWVDSQDIAGVEKEILRAAAVWLIGVQRESNEIERALSSIPKGIKRPKEGDIPTLRLGQFFVCWGEHVKKVYVQPAWMREADAHNIAIGSRSVEDCAPPKRRESEDENVDYKTAFEQAQVTIGKLEERIAQMEMLLKQKPGKPLVGQTHQGMPPAENSEEVAMSLEVKRPVIDVAVRKYVLALNDEDQIGRLAILISEGFFDSPKKSEHINEEFRARGWAAMTGRPSPKNLEMAKLAEYGFIRIVGQGSYQSVPGMKVNLKEVQVA
jgi:hypothetical protein